jgi:hypothetical protein
VLGAENGQDFLLFCDGFLKARLVIVNCVI